MIRLIATVAIALCLTPSWLCAQTTTLTVSVASADVHKFPSIGSPVIGQAVRGTVLEVRRNIGSWLAVSWPAGEGGAAFMHVITGSIANGSTPDALNPAAGTSPRPAPTTARVEDPPASQVLVPRRQVPGPTQPVYVGPTTHVVGLGARMGGSTLGLGVSTRAWRKDRIGLQIAVSRSALASSVGPGRLTSTQIEPSLLFRLPNRVGDYVWVRPYVGSGANLRRQTLSGAIPGAVGSAAQTGLGVQAFGGSEFTFAGLPRFAVSADLSYHWFRMPVAGFDLGGPGVSVSGHWYVK